MYQHLEAMVKDKSTNLEPIYKHLKTYRFYDTILKRLNDII